MNGAKHHNIAILKQITCFVMKETATKKTTITGLKNWLYCLLIIIFSKQLGLLSLGSVLTIMPAVSVAQRLKHQTPVHDSRVRIPSDQVIGKKEESNPQGDKRK